LKNTDTKQRIINNATVLFNKKGYSNVTMQEIAGATGISKGNLTYHFRKKENILEAVALSSTEYDFSAPETLKALDELITVFSRIVKDNSFYYLHDPKLEDLPGEIKNKQRKINDLIVELIKDALKNLNKNGLIRDEIVAGEYNTTAQTLHITCIYWNSYSRTNGIKITYREYAWKILYHLLTSRGVGQLHMMI